ncbi:MAG: BlaI/MecI/CopY family transcriptional regulator [Solirubrobacterales bacterium]
MAKAPDMQLQGDLQMEVMRALWRLDAPSSVEQVRSELPARHRSAYTTIQTVLNRLAERGLLGRKRKGKAILYSAKFGEAGYYSRTLRQTLAKASGSARRAALAQLVGDMAKGEREEVEGLAREVAKKRNGRRGR